MVEVTVFVVWIIFWLVAIDDELPTTSAVVIFREIVFIVVFVEVTFPFVGDVVLVASCVVSFGVAFLVVNFPSKAFGVVTFIVATVLACVNCTIVLPSIVFIVGVIGLSVDTVPVADFLVVVFVDPCVVILGAVASGAVTDVGRTVSETYVVVSGVATDEVRSGIETDVVVSGVIKDVVVLTVALTDIFATGVVLALVDDVDILVLAFTKVVSVVVAEPVVVIFNSEHPRLFIMNKEAFHLRGHLRLLMLFFSLVSYEFLPPLRSAINVPPLSS